MAPKNIAIFGATGMTGSVTLAQDLNAGYNVSVLVFDSDHLPSGQRPTKVIVGDVLNKSDVLKTHEGQEAVVIVLGTGSDLGNISEGPLFTSSLIHTIRKVVACMSCEYFRFVLWDIAKVPHSFVPLKEDHVRMHQVLKQDNCPPHLPFTGDYTVTVGTRGGNVISTHDLSHFFLQCLTTNEYNGKNVTLSLDYSTYNTFSACG
uniref:NAD(P)-binding domain-containing protein n=1 Tax=Xenopus tropicalis TaxID=8364 RepID=F7BZ75_XENTR